MRTEQDLLHGHVPTPAAGGTPANAVLDAAAAVKDAGTRVFTIGLGLPDDVLRDLLERAASSRGDYSFAPDAEDLEAVYREIAGRMGGCP